MTDYSKLVEALRCESLSKECDSCGYGYRLCPDSECNDACDVEQIYADAAAAIEALQAETVRLWPKRGKWINSKERMRPDMCSVCGCIYEADRFMDKIAWNYCPNCGADMRKMEVQE